MSESALARGTTVPGPEDTEFFVNGLRITGRIWGPADGRPVIATHGWLDNANTFEQLLPLLDLDTLGLRVFAMDFAGHGHSDHRPPGVHYMSILDIGDILAIADSLGWTRFATIGHSMGAGITSELSGMFPERIEWAVFIDGYLNYSRSTEDALAQNRKAVEQMLRAGAKMPPTYPDLDTMARRVTEATDQTFEAARTLVERGHRAVAGGFTWRSDPRIRFATPLRLPPRQIDALMAQVTAPSLLLVADRGDRWFVDSLERIREHNRMLEVVKMSGRHHLHLEQESVAEVAERVRAFIAKQD